MIVRSKVDTPLLEFTSPQPRTDQWRNNMFRLTLGNMPAGTFHSALITEIRFSQLDASSTGIAWVQMFLNSPPEPRTADVVPGTVAALDACMFDQRKRTHSATRGVLVLIGFAPARNDARWFRSRSGNIITFDDPGVPGRIVRADGKGSDSWSFPRGWLFNMGSRPISRGAPGNVLLVPEELRRGP